MKELSHQNYEQGRREGSGRAVLSLDEREGGVDPRVTEMTPGGAGRTALAEAGGGSDAVGPLSCPSLPSLCSLSRSNDPPSHRLSGSH